MREPGRGAWARYRLASLVFLVLAFACWTLVDGVRISLWQERGSDFFWRWLPQQAAESRIAVVDVDEQSLAELGGWPWPRDRMAALVELLALHGARQIALDVTFPPLQDADAAADVSLQRALRDFRAIPGQVLVIDRAPGEAAPRQGQPAGALAGVSCAEGPWSQTLGYIANAPALGQPWTGHMTPRLSADGVVRYLPALICDSGQAYPALSLAALFSGYGLPAEVRFEPGQRPWEPGGWLVAGANPVTRVPVNSRGELRIPYRLDRADLLAVSAADVLADRVPSGLLRDRWVLVGSTALGVGDAVPTPRAARVGGVEVHAQMLAGLLSGRVPVEPLWGMALAWLLALLSLGALYRLAGRSGRAVVWVLPAAGVALAVSAYLAHGLLLVWADLALPYFPAVTLPPLAALMLALLEHAQVRRDRERLFANFSSYLPAPVAARLAFQVPTGTIEAQRRRVTVLVADIRNGSAYCEGRPPEEAAALLHAFFSISTRVIEQHGGVVENFMGDSLLAIWEVRADAYTEPGGSRAVRAARSLLGQTQSLFSRPPPPGLGPMALGVGIETGEVWIGSLGLARRRVHTVMGETVTVAMRLQVLTADLSEPILLGPQSAAELALEARQDLGEFLIEGLLHARRVFAPRPAPAPMPF